MNSAPLFLGIDLGTSSLKLGLYDSSGRQRALAQVTYPTHEREGAEEQHTVDWWNALSAGVRRVMSSIHAERIAGIAVGGHAPSPAFVDENFHSLFPVLPWFDLRALREREQLVALVGRSPANGPQRLMSELAARAMWHRTRTPQTFARVRWILHSGDYLVARLTGQSVSTVAKVPGMFTAAGLSPALLPDRVCMPGEIAGTLQPCVAEELGLRPDVPVIAAGLDSFLAAIGSGLSETGDACVNSGSATVVTVMGLPGHEGRFEWNSLPVMSRPVLPGGRALHKTKRECGFDASTSDPIGAAARLRPPLPDSNHSPIERLRLLLDEVLLAQRTLLEELERYQPAKRLRGVGGLAASCGFGQLQADVLGRAIDSPEVTQSGSLGAAMLASIALGFHTAPSAASHMVRSARTYEPRADVAAFYAHRCRPER